MDKHDLLPGHSLATLLPICIVAQCEAAQLLHGILQCTQMGWLTPKAGKILDWLIQHS